ncbi:MAG: glucose-6-phosphate dehydrogenase, partial [Victivallaceae bacterium]
MNVHSGCGLVIFGASGDLCNRKLLPALLELSGDNKLSEDFQIFGVGRAGRDDVLWRQEAAETLSRLNYPPEVLKRFLARLHYRVLQYDSVADFDRLYEELHKIMHCSCDGENQVENGGVAGRVLFHLAVPPQVSYQIVESLGNSEFGRSERLRKNCAVLVEKPFGMDLQSAKAMNRLLTKNFSENNIYRIDHYLAKDTVRNIVVFRFANAIFEPLWNRNYIESVSIEANEVLGVEARGAYYDQSGVVRDMIQNHVLQLLALIAMEPPAGSDVEAIREKKHEVFKLLRPLTEDDWCLGQYAAYREAPGVAADSTTPTFAAMRVFVDNWRWYGVPFYLRSGKGLREKKTEITILFRSIPLCVLGDEQSCARVQKNVLKIRIQPQEGISFYFNVQSPGLSGQGIELSNLQFNYNQLGAVSNESYSRVVLDAMNGRPALFWRSDTVEEAWQFVAEMLDSARMAAAGRWYSYEMGS